jgi:tripartite-type tricarboxylate transporter receptor subunit TctC
MSRVKRRLLIALLAASVGASAFAADSPYPKHPVRMIVPFAPGGPTDVIARVIAQKLTETWAHQVVVDNRAGAGGNIGAELVAKSAPDGYTILFASSSFAIAPAYYKKLPYDALRDFDAVTQLSSRNNVTTVSASSAVNSVKELIALAKSKPGQLNYASSGIGTPPHLGGELFKAMAGVDIVHVPYREANSALNAVIAGNVQMMFSIATTAQAQITGGTVRGLGVATLKPTSLAPGLPTIASAGLDGFEVIGWNGIVAPAGTPAAIVSKLNAAIQHGIADPQLKPQLNAAGYDVAQPNTPEQFARFINDDTERWSSVVQKANIGVK